MRKTTAALLLGVGVLVAAWVGVRGETTTTETTDVLIRQIPGRYEIRQVSLRPDEDTNYRHVILLDTATGQTWGMQKGWESWKELPRTEAP